MNKLLRRSAGFILLVLTIAFAAPAQEQKISPDLRSLTDTERAFAKTAGEKGVRDSFIEFFADDGIAFEPGPVNAKESFRQSPAPVGPPPFTLNWQPVWGAISASGDLGFNTGPLLITDNTPQNRPARYGIFFSIWKKQPDGAWKVAVDMGVNTPQAVASLDAPYTVIGNVGNVTSKWPAEASQLRLVERQFLSAMQRQGVVRAYLNRLGDNARLHRSGIMPAVGQTAIFELLSAKPLTVSFETIKAEIARSGDFGWTMGRYELKSAPDTPAEKGHYVRVWQRNAKGEWKLLADVTNPLPAEAK